MTYAFALALLLYMGITSRQSGGGLGARYLPSWLTWLPEVFFSIPFGVVLYLLAYPLVGQYALGIGLLSSVWSYLWMQSATAPGLHWGNGGYNPNRSSRLKPLVDFINRYTFKADPSGEGYCWLYMGMKGFLIGLPVGGLPLAVLWPMGYWIGDELYDRGILKGEPAHALKEFLAGVGAGLAILAFVALVF
jgi:hypothetical protein